MTARIPSDADVLFVEASRTGTVHLLVLPPDEGPHLDPPESIPMDGSGRALAALLGTPMVTRCGLRTFPYHPGADAPHGLTARFSDDQLCGACYRTLHPDDHELAFEHKQPDDDEDHLAAALRLVPAPADRKAAS